MTPSDIEMLLLCQFCCPYLSRTPDVEKSIAKLKADGLIKQYAAGRYRTTARGHAHIVQICSLVLPSMDKYTPLPCPFCGGEAKTRRGREWGVGAKTGRYNYMVSCTNDMCPGSNVWGNDNCPGNHVWAEKEDAIRRWNEREKLADTVFIADGATIGFSQVVHEESSGVEET